MAADFLKIKSLTTGQAALSKTKCRRFCELGSWQQCLAPIFLLSSAGLKVLCEGNQCIFHWWIQDRMTAQKTKKWTWSHICCVPRLVSQHGEDLSFFLSAFVFVIASVHAQLPTWAQNGRVPAFYPWKYLWNCTHQQWSRGCCLAEI